MLENSKIKATTRFVYLPYAYPHTMMCQYWKTWACVIICALVLSASASTQQAQFPIKHWVVIMMENRFAITNNTLIHNALHMLFSVATVLRSTPRNGRTFLLLEVPIKVKRNSVDAHLIAHPPMHTIRFWVYGRWHNYS